MHLLEPLQPDNPIRLVSSMLTMPECDNAAMAGKFCFHLSAYKSKEEQPFVWWVQDDPYSDPSLLAGALCALAEKLDAGIFVPQ
jgi:hypothetical protein